VNFSHTNDDSLFYCDIEITEETNRFINPLKEYSIQHSKQIYILKKALGTNKDYNYELSDVAIILMPKHPILILNYKTTTLENLEDFLLDFKEDLGYLSDKYNYNKILGRPRKWPSDFFVISGIDEFNIDEYLTTEIGLQYQRKIDLLISLLIGSINNIEKIGLSDPESLLEKVKQKIILFDGQQSRFIYQTKEQDTITIQGMAGTGKTELLLHKLKDVYSSEKNSAIVFTCHNKVLANDMRVRIPRFFNFLKVDEQIEWDDRLHVFPSWGSASNPNSGLYSFLCKKYDLSFIRYSENHDFNAVCYEALQELNEQENFEPCFDYIFIDESQDFKEGFFELCKKVSKKTVYIAGDIFQNIYDTSVTTDIKPDFLLNKCYRTDPKTLMFAHAVGMGLYETPQINWLDDNAWVSCGYSLDRESSKDTITLSRSPLRRFEDLDATNTIRLLSCDSDSYSAQIISCIQEIRNENPTVTPEDIAVIILGDYRTLCTVANETAFMLQRDYDWDSSKGYETKEKSVGKLYISNVNNIKGLEFPFVICVVTRTITTNILSRNSIYMALTRSFLTSYFIVDNRNSEFVEIYSAAIARITNEGKMELHEPSPDERKEMANRIRITLSSSRKSFEEIMDDFFNKEYPYLKLEDRKFVADTIKQISANLTEEQIKQRSRSFVDGVLGAGKA
jgi:superfamily I DNA and RNA helicase